MAEFNGKEPILCRACGKEIKPYARVFRAALNNEAASSRECAAMIDIATEDMNYAKRYLGLVLINASGKAGIVTSVRPHKKKLTHALFGYGTDGTTWTARDSFTAVSKEDSEALKIAFMPPIPDATPFTTSEVEAAVKGLESAIDRVNTKVEGIFTTLETKVNNVFTDSLLDIWETDSQGKRKKKK